MSPMQQPQRDADQRSDPAIPKIARLRQATPRTCAGKTWIRQSPTRFPPASAV